MPEPWTPGPWHVSSNGEDVYSDGAGNLLVASLPWQGRTPEADARLIALAPEMAEMIEKLLIVVRAHFQPQGVIPADVGDPMMDAVALLARARGASYGEG